MTKAKFGEQITLTFSPGLVLGIEEVICEWIQEIASKGGEIDERDTIDVSQRVALKIKEICDSQIKNLLPIEKKT